MLARGEGAPAALRNRSGGANERVACGNTVLLSRSLAGFFATRTGEDVGFCSAASGAQRDVSFLKRLRNLGSPKTKRLFSITELDATAAKDAVISAARP